MVEEVHRRNFRVTEKELIKGLDFPKSGRIESIEEITPGLYEFQLVAEKR